MLRHLHCGLKIVELATFLAAGIFNEGFTFVLHVMQEINLVVDHQCQNFCTSYDAKRVTRQNRRTLNSSKKARTARKEEQSLLLQNFEEQEDQYYGPGIAE